MTFSDFLSVLPLLIIAGTSVAIMLVIAVHRSHLLTIVLTLTGLVLALSMLPSVSTLLPRQVTKLLILDSYAFFYMALIFAATIVTSIFSYSYLERGEGLREEFYLLLLLAALGAAVLVVSSHLVSFFLGIEILSVSLYGLIAYQRDREHGIEAGIKYLVLAAVSSAFLLFGMALIYFDTGTMELGRLALLTNAFDANHTVLIGGTVLLLTGIGFKLAVVPFHMWTPDVYEGAPAPVTAFIATVSKGAVFALVLRYFGKMGITGSSPLFPVFTCIAAASMIVGNLLALFQNNVKRILAYSSISHFGYMLVAFLAGGSLSVIAVTFYLVAYFVTILGAFGTITLLTDGDNEADTIDHFRSLVWKRPWIAGIFAAMIFSLAGIPLTAGFIGKLYVLFAGVKSALWYLVFILVVSSAIGLFYYLRIIIAIFEQPGEAGEGARTYPSASTAAGIILGVLMLMLIWLGVYPGPLIDAIRELTVIY